MRFEYVDPLLERVLGNDAKDKEKARDEYREKPPWSYIPYEPLTKSLLRGWLAISVDFELQAPWFSKDDIPCHVFDNPVHRDRVFRAPFMSASSWKGLLRWRTRMRSGLLGHLETYDNQLEGWKDSAELVHLFGNERGKAENFQRGALAFRPTWFDKVGFEVINPHDRTKKAGKNPLIYEVVPPGATGTLNLLYAPTPSPAATGVDRQKALLLLLDAIDDLVTKYGFSAKRTSGWGIATITKVHVSSRDHGSREGTLSEGRAAVADLLKGRG